MIQERVSQGPEVVARVLMHQPDRVSAAWRRLRYAQGRKGDLPCNLLDTLVEPFVREIGKRIAGGDQSPWTRTQGVLRVSPERGVRALYEEFSALRRCLQDTVEVLGGGPRERSIVNSAIDEAVDSAIAIARQFEDPHAAGPMLPFGGLVVEFYEQAKPTLRAVTRDEMEAVQ